MKRIISWVLLAVMMLSLFAGCGNTAPAADPTNAPAASTEAVVVPDENLENAIAYLKTFYKSVRDGDHTPSDYERLGTVRVGLTAYEVVYTLDCDESVAKVVKGDDGTVMIDVNEDSEVEVPYALTATITGTDGKTASLTWNHVLPVSLSIRSAEIVDAAYALEEGEALPYQVTLKGEIISVDTPYSPDYKNITVSIKITGREDKPIMCYRLKGAGCDALVPGDIITVTGTIKNYKGTIEFDAGCALEKVEKSANSLVIPTDPQEILEAAFALKGGESLPYQATLTGRIIGIKTPYSAQYGNISVVIRTGEPWYDITCYRMKGEDVDKIGREDIITVTGILKNYGGHTIEFDTGSLMVDWIDTPDPVAPEDPAEIIKQAQKLNNGASLPYYCYLTGTVDSVTKEWNPPVQNVRLWLSVGGGLVECYKLVGDDVEDVQAGDTITVWGKIEKYNGKIQIYKAQLIGPEDEQVVDKLYKLKDGESIEDAQLDGKITAINRAYNGSSITVTMTVAGLKNKPVRCVNMAGIGADLLEVGDTIEVSGKLTNNEGSYQYANGCKLVRWTNANIPKVNNRSSNEEVLAAAALLGVGQRLIGVCLDGDITRVNTPYSSRYGNVTVTITVNGQSVICNRLGENEGAAKIGVGDHVKVYGKLWKNANGALEFQNNCGLVSYKLLDKSDIEIPATLKEQMDQAVANGENIYKSTAQGKIMSDLSYSSEHKNWSFTVYDSASGELVYCYGLDSKKELHVGDIVKVEGRLTSHNGSAQFSYSTDSKVTLIEAAPSVDADELTGLAKDLYDASKLNNGQYLGRKTKVDGTVYSVTGFSSREIGRRAWSFKLAADGEIVPCYYVVFDKAVEVKNGDKISIEGNLTAFNGAAQFDETATILSHNCADFVAPEVDANSSLADQLAAAGALGSNEKLPFKTTVTGTVTGTIQESSRTSGSYRFTLSTSAGDISCYYVPVVGGEPKMGDTITVTGNLSAYNGKAQFYESNATAYLDSAEGDCTHTYQSEVVTLEPTCIATGLKNIVCTDCEKVIQKDVEIPATGEHIWDADGKCTTPECDAECEHTATETVNTATCGAAGKETVTCQTCGKIVSETDVPATGVHTDTTTTVTATCTTAGVTTVTCACGEVVSTTDTPALNHDWSNKDGVCARTGCGEKCEHADKETVNTATCGAAGKETVTCKTCGYVVSQTDKEATNEHSFAGNGPTCDKCPAPNPDFEENGEGG